MPKKSTESAKPLSSIAFFGSGPFAVPIVALLHAQKKLRLLVTQDDTKFWKKRVGSEVEIWHGDQSYGAQSYGDQGCDDRLHRILLGEEGKGRVDAIVTASYGSRLSDETLRCARLGSYNVHASLLPRWRGASPIQRAILHGDTQSGVSIIKMSDRIDCGGVVLRKRVLLRASETYDSLEENLSALGAAATSELLESLSHGEVCAEPQEESSACWAGKLRREEGLLDWHAPAEHLERQVRAFLRWPGSFFFVRGERIVVHAARLEPSAKRVAGENAAGENAAGENAAGENAGRVLRTHPYPIVACGAKGNEGALGLLRLQRAGRKALEAAAFLRGFRLETGANLSEFSCVKHSD